MARQHNADHRRQGDRCGSRADQRIDYPPSAKAIVAQPIDGIALRAIAVPTETKCLHFVVKFGANSQGAVVLDAVVQHLTEHEHGIAQNPDDRCETCHTQDLVQLAFAERGKKQGMNPVGVWGW